MAISKSYFRWSDSVVSTRSPTDPIDLVPAYTPWHPDDDANFPVSIAKGESYYNATYGTLMTRLTDAAIDRAPSYSGLIVTPYSRHQYFNVDSSLFLGIQSNGFWIVYDAENYSVVRVLEDNPVPAGDQCEMHWHPTDPNKVRYSAYQGNSFVFYERDVITNVVVTLFDLRTVAEISGYPGDTSILDIWPTASRIWNHGEGRCSTDCNIYGFLIEDDTVPLGLITYNLAENKIVGVLDASAWGGSRFDHGSVTPSGRYYVPSGDATGVGTRAYKIDFSEFVTLHHKSEHSDLGTMPNGNDFYFSLDFQDNEGRCFWTDIDATFANPSAVNNTSAISKSYMTNYLYGYGTGGPNPTSRTFHASARCVNLPGWIIMSCYDDIAESGWSEGQIYAVEMADDPKILQIAHGNNNHGGEYWAEMFANVNPDGTKILVPSNWGETTPSEIVSSENIYEISIPAGSIPNHRDVI